jgi:hypothetical protein
MRKLIVKWKKSLKTMFNGPYVVINKVHMKGYPSRKLFIIHLEISIEQKMTKIGTFENKAQM